MKAVVMAGGEGVRLRPITCTLPKPMLPVLNKPIIMHILELLKKHSIDDVIITLSYLPKAIIKYFNDLNHGINIQFCIDDNPLGTAGSVKNALGSYDDTVLIISGDALTNIDLSSFLKFHRANKALASIVVKKSEDPIDYGVVVLGEAGRVNKFQEKPSWGEVTSDLVNTGIYCLEPEVLRLMPSDEKFDFAKDVFPQILETDRGIYGYKTTDYWSDIGNRVSFINSNLDYLNMLEDKITIGEHCDISPNAKIIGPCVIGKNTRIDEECIVGPYQVIGEDCYINKHASIKGGIIFSNSNIGSSAHLRNCIICSKVDIGKRVQIYDQAVIGESTLISDDVLVKKNVNIWPYKIIEADRTVSDNITNSKQIKSDNIVDGEWKISIDEETPLSVINIISNYATNYKIGSRLGLCVWGNNQAQKISDAISLGLQSAGLDVCYIGSAPAYMLRFAVRSMRLAGGIFLYLHQNKLSIIFYDSSGCRINYIFKRRMINSIERDQRAEIKISDFGEKHDYTGIDKVFAAAFEAFNTDVFFYPENYKSVIYTKRIFSVENKNHIIKAKLNEIGDVILITIDEHVFKDEGLFILKVQAAYYYGIINTDIPLPPYMGHMANYIKEGAKHIETDCTINAWMEHLMKNLVDENLKFIADGIDTPAFIMMISELLNTKISLEYLISSTKYLPFSISNKCEFNSRGRIITALIADGYTELTNGVLRKNFSDCNVYIKPDCERPFLKIYGYNAKMEIAEDVVGQVSKDIEKLHKNTK